MQNKHVVVLSGAGISAESGLKTFRDSGGLWEGHNVYEVASIDGWRSNPKKILEFYNHRRKQLLDVNPNEAHRFIAELENSFDVTVVTQNVDDLHERAGSSNVIHLHGELKKARSEVDPQVIINIDHQEINLGDLAPDGHQLRPAIVWFGEMVPLIEVAAQIVMDSDYLIVVGTSLAVYPAAGLVNYAPNQSKKYIVDPGMPELISYKDWIHIQKSATEGVEELKNLLFD
jgi:NAD-dependent deacetylase